MKFWEPKDRIIVALDVADLAQARLIVSELAPYVGMFKIGLELLTSTGAPNAVANVHSLGGLVMFDGKFHDIPTTMGAAARVVANLGVEMFTVHASAGRESVAAAVANAGESKVVGVTVLTSLKKADCLEIYGDTPNDVVSNFAEMLEAADAHAIVCSPEELHVIGATSPLIRITPGVRPSWAEVNDQQRVMTPAEAICAGADYLVIGRPILRPPPTIGGRVKAAKRVAAEIAEVSR